MSHDDDYARRLLGLLRHYFAPIELTHETIGPRRESVHELQPHRDFCFIECNIDWSPPPPPAAASDGSEGGVK